MPKLLRLLAFCCCVLFWMPNAHAAPEPVRAATNLSIYSSCNQFDIVWTVGSGSQRLVLLSETPITTSNLPVDGTVYSANPQYGGGDQINGAFVVWSSNGSNVTVNGLVSGHVYYAAVFEYNGNGNGINYLTSVYPTDHDTAKGVELTLSVSDSVLCAGSSAILTAGGDALAYYWSPSSDLVTFYDTIAIVTPVDTSSYTVTAYGADGCSDSISVQIAVAPVDSVSLTLPASTCTNSGPLLLTGGAPSAPSGFYSGDSVYQVAADYYFHSTRAGTFVIRYSYTNAYGCTGTDTATIVVRTPVAAALGVFSSICMNAAPLQLNGGTPAGGFYTGPGVNGGYFFPTLAGAAGPKTITYNYIANGCTTTVSNNSLILLDTPAVNLASFFPVCEDFGPFQLYGGTPAGGVYSYSGTNSSLFNPSVTGPGVFPITYTYLNVTTGCSGRDTSTITVWPLPVVTLASPSPLCDNQGQVLLTGGFPAGGSYSGLFISNNRFNTALSGDGDFRVVYSYADSHACGSSDTAYITVKRSPVVDLVAQDPVCLNTPPYPLSGGTPAGGFYYGNGVMADTLTPYFIGPGTSYIYYWYNDTTGCYAVDSALVEVRGLPTVGLPSYPSRCVNIGPYVLTGGTPAGGVFFGRGILNDVFYSAVAGVGVDTVSYRYTDPVTGCSDTAQETITVHPFPSVYIGPDVTVYNNGSVQLNAGNPGCTFLWSTGATTQSILIDTSGLGFGTFSFRVRVTNQFGCYNRDTVLVTFAPLVGVPMIVPDDESISAYPNPFSGTINIEVAERMQLMVKDACGRSVLERFLEPGSTQLGSGLPAGSYTALFVSEKGCFQLRLLKQ